MVAPILRPHVLAIRPTSQTPASDLSAMLWDHPGATVDLVCSEATIANCWAPNVEREARGRLSAMAFHERRIMEELRRLLPPELFTNSTITLALRYGSLWTGMVIG